MNAAQQLVHQTRYEQLSFWRNPVAGILTVTFPLLFLVIFAGQSGTVGEYGGISAAQYVVPQMMIYGIANATFTNPTVSLVNRREMGLLKRMRLAPVPSWAALGGIAGNALVTTALLLTVVLGLGFGAYHVHWYGHLVALAVAVVVAVLCLSSLGAAASTFVPNEDAGPPIVNITFIGLLFLSGTFIPVRPGSALSYVGNVFPLRHLSTAVLTAFLPTGQRGLLHGFAWSDVGVAALWGVGAALVAVRRWRWEPRR